MRGIREHGERLKDCVLDLVVGEPIAEGTFRDVYALDDKRVLKVEARGKAFCNTHEWTIWNDSPKEWEKWFAPCLAIDDFSIALVQRRTRPLTDKQWDALTEVPDFMADLKRENWGWLDGRPVCHDYGNHRFFANGFKRGKMTRRPA